MKHTICCEGCGQLWHYEMPGGTVPNTAHICKSNPNSITLAFTGLCATEMKPVEPESLLSIGKRRRAGKFDHPHYADLYERYVGPKRLKHINLLELGVASGQSLLTWLDYFPKAFVVGADLNPVHNRELETYCLEMVPPRCKILQCDQADELLTECGSLDIIIDDAGHDPDKQRASLELLWPKLLAGGVYVIEDLEVSYWPEDNYRDGWQRGAVQYLKDLADGLTASYARKQEYRFPTLPGLDAIHWHKNVVFMEKGQ